MPSPYTGIPPKDWRAKTEELVKAHPLALKTIREIAEKSWHALWQTTVGEGKTALKLSEIDVPATVIGYFFEKLFAKELASRFPLRWRGNQSKDEKDFVYIPDAKFSVEMKTSGQAGTKIYGNRSYGKKSKDVGSTSKLEKSGYYITVNFFGKMLTLLRFGWIDIDDWESQKSETGQAASLKKETYQYKLIDIDGDYRLNAPIEILDGVGEKTAEKIKKKQINTVNDLLNYKGDEMWILKLKEVLKR